MTIHCADRTPMRALLRERPSAASHCGCPPYLIDERTGGADRVDASGRDQTLVA